MTRQILVSGVSVFLLLGAGSTWRLTAGPRRLATTPAPALPVEPAKASDATGKMVAAAEAFLATLDDAGRAKVNFPFASDKKAQWSNFPVGVYRRNGLRWGDLSAPERGAARRLLAAALSPEGLRKVERIMQGDEVLKTSQGNGFPTPARGNSRPVGPVPGDPRDGPGPGGPPGGGPRGAGGPRFGRDEYYLALFGAPSLTRPWMLQFGGHHLAINVTVVGKRNVLTPSLPAAQPAEYTLDGEAVRPLGREADLSFALVNALTPAQRKQAVLPYQVSDLVLGPGEDGKTIQPEGIRADALTPVQQQNLLALVGEWVGILNTTAAASKMAEVKARLPETWFAWSGPITSGSPAYFRIQGPTLLIEYSPQRLRGAGGLDPTHIHTIYRDPTNDYGARLVER
jgi:hypothetical protein